MKNGRQFKWKKKLATLTLNDLADLSLTELEVLFSLGRTPEIADLHGPMNGLPLAGKFDPGQITPVWKGKIFKPLDADGGIGTNRITPAGSGAQIEEFEFLFSQGPPLSGGTEVVILNYDLEINSPAVRTIRDDVRQLNDHLFLGTANRKTDDGYEFLLYFGLQYRCPASAHFQPGPTDAAWYDTLTPFEVYDSIRTELFPHTCTAQTIANSDQLRITVRASKSDYPSLYNLVTRNRNELFVNGGWVAEGSGSYVARIDAVTLREKWRVYLQARSRKHWNYPGGVAVLGDGAVLAIAGNLLSRIEPDAVDPHIVSLPQHPGQGGAAYNGFVVSPDGVIFTKSMERGQPCDEDKARGLRCAADNGVPAFLVAADGRDLNLVATVETEEPGLGRLMTERRDGIDYVYFPGVTKLWRYMFKDGRLELDPSWGPVEFFTDGQGPAAGAGLMGEWVIFQTNFLPSTVPLTMWAVHVKDSDRRHHFQPFPTSTRSQAWSKAAQDLDHHRLYVNDQLAGRVAGIEFDPEKGFRKVWEAPQQMGSFWALVGDRNHRQVLGTNFALNGDHAIWRDAATGQEVVSSPVLDPKFNASIISPGFGGRFYYMAEERQKVLELTPEALVQP